MERIAERAAELLAARQEPSTNGEGWIRGAARIAEYIGATRSRVYALATCRPPRIPVRRDGSNLVAKRSELDRWIDEGGGIRP
jgi:hypothetical protein